MLEKLEKLGFGKKSKKTTAPVYTSQRSVNQVETEFKQIDPVKVLEQSRVAQETKTNSSTSRTSSPTGSPMSMTPDHSPVEDKSPLAQRKALPTPQPGSFAAKVTNDRNSSSSSSSKNSSDDKMSVSPGKEPLIERSTSQATQPVNIPQSGIELTREQQEVFKTLTPLQQQGFGALPPHKQKALIAAQECILAIDASKERQKQLDNDLETINGNLTNIYDERKALLVKKGELAGQKLNSASEQLSVVQEEGKVLDRRFERLIQQPKNSGVITK